MEGVFSLTGDGDYARCSKSFLFTLVNPQGLEPTKMPITTDGQKYGICCYSEYGPTFGRGLYGGYALKISDHANVRSSDFGISDSYDFHQDFRTFFTGKTQFLVSDYEVFSLVNQHVAIDGWGVSFNLLTLKGDKHLISPYNSPPESHIKVMRLKEMITK